MLRSIYIHNWPLQPFYQDYDLASHTTYVECVNFIYKWRDLKFKVDSELQIFWETFHGNFYLFSEFLPEILWEDVAEEIFSFWCLTWGLNPGFTSNKQTHYLLDYGDFHYLTLYKNWRVANIDCGRLLF